jgi:flagellar biosynthesis protein FlhG
MRPPQRSPRPPVPDQASTLRDIVNAQAIGQTAAPAQARLPAALRVIAVTSGKGGVGKTNLVLNLGLALSRMQRRVFLLDADLGLANVDVLLGLSPRYTLEHVLNGQRDIMDIVLEGPAGMRILPSGSGISELAELGRDQQMRLFRELSRIGDGVDYLFIDTGAGISSNVLRFNASANEVIVVANPEPTSITDAYALMKLLSIKYHIREFGLIANSVASDAEGAGVFDRLNRVCGQFLQVRLSYLGSVPFDKHVREAVRRQQALLDAFPQAPAAKSIARIAAELDRTPLAMGVIPQPAPATAVAGVPTPGSFWDRLLHWKRVK